MKRLFISYVMALFALVGFAQETQLNLQGTVLDSFLKIGVKDCRIELLRKDSTATDFKPEVFEIGVSLSKFSTLYNFYIPNEPGEYLVHVSKDGYEDGWGKVTVPAQYRQLRMTLPTIYIRKSAAEHRLGEAVVQATRVKVKMRGDTLVYDATAFDLPDGSLLQNLIEQLPGAKMNEAGEIYINGRKIDELTLNSRTLFNGNKAVLLENLPYFTVKELKVFERHSLHAVMTQDFNAEKEYIMDVTLKDEYALGGTVNGEVAGGTHDRYLAKLFGFLLTKTLTVGAYANLNNINDDSTGFNGLWATTSWTNWGGANHPSKRKGTGLSFNYQSEKKRYGYPEVFAQTEVHLNWKDDFDESGNYKEFFFPAGTTYSRMNQNMSYKNKSFDFSQKLIHAPWGIDTDVRLNYKEGRSQAHSILTQWGLAEGTTEQYTDGMGKKREYGLAKTDFRFFGTGVKGLELALQDLFLYRTEKQQFKRQYSTQNQRVDTYRHEYQDETVDYYNYAPQATYNFPIWKLLKLSVKARYQKGGKKSTDNLFVLSDLEGWGLEDSVKLDLLPSSKEMLWHAYDPVNSTFSDFDKQEGTFAPSFELLRGKHQPVSIRLRLPFQFLHERLAFRRDVLDTLATRNMFSVNPSLRVNYKNLKFNMDYQESSPGLRNLMPYYNAHNPLQIVEGNPNLKDNQKWHANLSWSREVTDKGMMKRNMRVESDFTYFARSVGQKTTYNPQTTAYTYRPENVRGNWIWNTSHTMSLALGNKQSWWLDNELSADVMHSVDFSAVEGLNEAQLNRVETVRPREMLKIRYTSKLTKAMILGEVTWRHTWGHRPSQEKINAFDFRYGMTAQHTIKNWNTTFNVDAFMYSRRGYNSAVMNRNECVVNASVSQSLFRGMMTLKLEGCDIFNRKSATTYEVNAQGLTESWHRILPNYIMLHLTYNFRRQPKN